MLSGLELLALPLTGVLVKGQVKLVIYIGIGGVFGVLIGILLIAAGLVLWVNPTHRVFYGIAGIVLGIISFPASNLGGFVLGMLLAIIGGALAFAWVPAEPQSVDAAPSGPARDDAPADRPDDDRPDDDAPADRADDDAPAEPERSAGLDLITEPRAQWEGTATIADEAAGPDGGVRSATPPRTGRWPSPRCRPCWWRACSAPAGWPRQHRPSPPGCILGILCPPSASPTPTPTPTPTSSTAAPSPTPSVSSSASASPSPTPSAGQSGTAAPSATPTPSTAPSASPSPSATSAGGGKSASAKAKKVDPKDATAPGGTASSAASVLTAGSATLTDFQHQGNSPCQCPAARPKR